MAIPIRNLLPAYLKCYDDIIPHGKVSHVVLDSGIFKCHILYCAVILMFVAVVKSL